MLRGVLAVCVVGSVAALGGWFASSEAADGASHVKSDVVVRLGDRIRVADAPIGCRVVRMRQLGGRIVVDCRRAGALSGTYGTLLTAREAAVMRFHSKRSAKLVVLATHEGGVRRCS
jgi:hypothetical protein